MHTFLSLQVFNVPGRCFPVDVIHSTEDHGEERKYLHAAVDTALQVHVTEGPGGWTAVTVFCAEQVVIWICSALSLPYLVCLGRPE